MSTKWLDILGTVVFIIFSCYWAYIIWFKPEEFKRKAFGKDPSWVDRQMMTGFAMWMWRILTLIFFIASIVVVIAFVISALKELFQ